MALKGIEIRPVDQDHRAWSCADDEARKAQVDVVSLAIQVLIANEPVRAFYTVLFPCVTVDGPAEPCDGKAPPVYGCQYSFHQHIAATRMHPGTDIFKNFVGYFSCMHGVISLFGVVTAMRSKKHHACLLSADKIS